MNILMFNSNDPMRASGIVALDLFRGLRNKGHNVRLLVNEYNSGYPEDIISLETHFMVRKKKIMYKIKRRLIFLKKKPKDINYHFHSFREKDSNSNVKKLLKRAEIKPDVIIVLFAKDFINSKNIYELFEQTQAPVLWLMYDMAPITGGCHYAWNCKGYQNSCGNCPGLYSKDAFDITYDNLLIKKTYIDKTNIHLLPASEWQYRQALSSTLFKNKDIHKILLSVDPVIFKPVDKNEIRSKLGLPADKKIVFFGAVYMADQRKGLHYLLECLKIMSEKLGDTHLGKNILLLIAGREVKEIIDSVPFEHHSMGYLDNTYGIASAYQAADAFLCPSIEDSGPQMINQSIMCGTPVVSFEMGVAVDLVITGKTGYMAKLRDSNDLATGLISVLSKDDNDYKEISDNCRRLGLELCSPSVQLEQIEKVMADSMIK